MPQAFGFANGVLPILLLVGLTILLPFGFAGWIGNSFRRLFLVMLAVLAVLLLVGAVLLAYLTLQEDPSARAVPLDLLARSARLGLAWGPVWLLVWLVRAQGAERRKGLAMGRDGKGRDAG